MRVRALLVATPLVVSCLSEPSERSMGDYDVSLSEDCPAYEFQDFQEPYGILYCEVYIGCFGTSGNRENGVQAETVEECLELSCGGANGLEGEVECMLDEDRAEVCLEEMTAIASDLEDNCPNIDDAWFPEDCGLAIDCADN